MNNEWVGMVLHSRVKFARNVNKNHPIQIRALTVARQWLICGWFDERVKVLSHSLMWYIVCTCLSQWRGSSLSQQWLKLVHKWICTGGRRKSLFCKIMLGQKISHQLLPVCYGNKYKAVSWELSCFAVILMTMIFRSTIIDQKLSFKFIPYLTQ